MPAPAATAKSRPAETAGLAGAVAVLVAWAAGVDQPAVIAAIGVVVGALPAAVTWVVQRRSSAAPDG